MTKTLEFPVVTEKYNAPNAVHADVGGSEAIVTRRLSPFLVPREVLVKVDDKSGAARFDFRYPDDEPAGAQVLLESGVQLNLGKNSWKILSANFKDLDAVTRLRNRLTHDLLSEVSDDLKAADREVLVRHADVLCSLLLDLYYVIRKGDRGNAVEAPGA